MIAGHGPLESDTCRDYVLPALDRAGWRSDQIAEQRYFTDGSHRLAEALDGRGVQPLPGPAAAEQSAASAVSRDRNQG